MSYDFLKKLSLSIVYSKCRHEEESIEILKTPDLVNNIGEYNRISNHVWKENQEFRLEKK